MIHDICISAITDKRNKFGYIIIIMSSKGYREQHSYTFHMQYYPCGTEAAVNSLSSRLGLSPYILAYAMMHNAH